MSLLPSPLKSPIPDIVHPAQNGSDTVEVTTQGRRDVNHIHAERRTDLRGRDYYWMGFHGRAAREEEGVDMAAIAAGRISITPLHIDMTHRESCRALRAVLGGPPPRLRAPIASEA